MENKRKIELEGILPDYVLDRLDSDFKAKFESEKTLFPELDKEIEEAKNVFEHFNVNRYREFSDARSRNISVKLADRLATRKIKKSIFSKYLMPSLGLTVIIVALIILPNYLRYDKSNASIDKFEITNIKAEEISQLLNDSITNVESVNLSTSEQALISENDETFSKYTADDFDNALNVSLNKLIGSNANAAQSVIDPSYDPYDNFNNLNEEEFTKIYKELQNEKFPS